MPTLGIGGGGAGSQDETSTIEDDNSSHASFGVRDMRVSEDGAFVPGKGHGRDSSSLRGNESAESLHKRKMKARNIVPRVQMKTATSMLSQVDLPAVKKSHKVRECEERRRASLLLLTHRLLWLCGFVAFSALARGDEQLPEQDPKG